MLWITKGNNINQTLEKQQHFHVVKEFCLSQWSHLDDSIEETSVPKIRQTLQKICLKKSYFNVKFEINDIFLNICKNQITLLCESIVMYK